MTTKNEHSNNINNYYCMSCDYICFKKYNYDRHILTSKHINKQKTTQNEQKEQKEQKEQNNKYTCNTCNKIYNDRAGLWRHKKKCVENNNNVSTNEFKMLTNLVLEVVKNNSELQKQNNELQKQNQELQKNIIDVMKIGTNTSNSNNTNINNSHNKTFNLQFFLNEECKNAMNIGEFVSSIKMDLDDLERTGLLGYSEGISNIINKNLKCLIKQ